jgi:hypothetical protein
MKATTGGGLKIREWTGKRHSNIWRLFNGPAKEALTLLSSKNH